MRTPGIPIAASRATAGRYLACLRWPEILVLQGSPLLGLAFALRSPAVEDLGLAALLVAANVCLVAHVFLVNDWSNVSADLADPAKVSRVFTARGVSRQQLGGFSLILLALSLALFSRLGQGALGLATAIAALGALYSLPCSNWKERPLLSSVTHLAGGTLHFLLGYSAATAVDGRGLVTASFFGLTFAAGHLTQEVRDHQGDARNGLRTNAVVFGPRRAFVTSVVLFGLAHAALFALALAGTLPRPLVGLVVLYPIQLRWSLTTLAEGLTRDGICRLQARYRALYAVIGLAVVAALCA
jgi:4-hydroxybenzoate polyprenyltransferase